MLKDKNIVYTTTMNRFAHISLPHYHTTCTGPRASYHAPGPACIVRGSEACVRYTGLRRAWIWVRRCVVRGSVHPGTQGRPAGDARVWTMYHGFIRRIGVPGAFFFATLLAKLNSTDNFIRTSVISRGKFPGISTAMSQGAW